MRAEAFREPSRGREWKAGVNAEALLRAVAPESRAPQDYIAESIEEFLESADSRTLCVNASTGVGKTLAYGAPAVLAASRGRKVVISTHTTQQLDQIMHAIRSLAAPAPAPIATARRLGRANFLSPARIARILANRPDLDDDERTLLMEARAHAGRIDEFENSYGLLPAPRADLCLTASCPNQAAYDAQREEAGAAAIVVQTHAMSILDAVRGAFDANIAIHDEADALPSAAAGFAESRVTSLDLAAAARGFDLPTLEDAAAAFGEWAAGAVEEDGPVFRQNAPEAVEHARAVRAALEEREDERLRDLRRALDRFIRFEPDPARPQRGAAVAAAPGGYAFQVLALDPARVLRRTYKGRKTVFVSATLDVRPGGGEPDYAPFLRSVGADPREAGGPRVEIEDFGAMTFVLADRRAPEPFGADGARDPAFDDHAARVVRAAMSEGGRTLALAASFDDVEALAVRVEGLIAHRRGEALAACLERFRAAPRGVLATPSAWAGVDLPGLLAHIAILRVPFPPPDSARVKLLRRLLESRGHDGAGAKGILARRNRLDAIRRLAQGLGRGVRGPGDRVKVWIADPRFPSPDTFTLDPRRSLGRTGKSRHRDLAGAIPDRFTDAYERATIFPAGRES